MRYALIVGAWELVRPLLKRGLTLSLRRLWAWELRREMQATSRG